MSRHEQRGFKIGLIGTFAIASAVLIFFYATTFKSSEQTTFLSAIGLLIAGLMMAWMMTGIRFEWTLRDLGENIVFGAISVVVIYLINRLVPFRVTATLPISQKLFAVLMGVAEECFFRLWLCGFVMTVTKSQVLAVIVSSTIWSIYHIARYGGEAGAFMVIWMAGLILGAVLLYSKRGDGVIFAHAFVNFIATA